MKTYKREDWRTCENCVHKNVCYEPNKHKECNYHIYDADPQVYGDLTIILEPLQEWLTIHYPNDAKFLVEKYSAELLMEHKFFYDEKEV